jgi:CheY-like chemotaxis protein
MPYGSVLIVDDVEANLFVAKGLMKLYGLSIETVLSGYEALEKIRAGAVYDIVFMDHMMPGMDGIETTKLLREEGYTQPIVALTANALAGQADVFLSKGFDDFVSKPIDIRHLNNVLNKQIRDKQPSAVLDEARLQNENDYAGSEADGSTDQSCSISLLKKIENLEVDSALHTMSGLTDVYLDTIRLSKRLLPERIDRMDRYIETDMKSFTVEVHGLKSVLRNIGADALGNQAAQLESAALENNQSYCNESYPVFRAALVKLKDSLDEALKHETVDTKKTGDISQLKQAVTDAKAAAESFDRDHALEIIAPCADFVYNEHTDELLKEIIFALEAFDCEGALKKMEQLKEG